MSQAVVAGGFVFLSGQVGEGADAREQTRNILDGIDGLLDRAGTNRASILSANIWLADMADFDAMNAVWDAWVPDGGAPARACVQAALASPRFRVEIAVIALDREVST